MLANVARRASCGEDPLRPSRDRYGPHHARSAEASIALLQVLRHLGDGPLGCVEACRWNRGSTSPRTSAASLKELDGAGGVGPCRPPAAAPLPIAPDDLAELRRWARSSQLPPCWRSRPGSCCWPLTAPRIPTSPSALGLVADRDHLPAPVCAPRAGRTARPTSTGTASDPAPDPSGRDPQGHAQPAPTTARDHPLVDSAAGPRAGRQSRHHCPRLARVRSQAVARRDLQVLHRPAAGGQGPRRRRAVFAATRTRGRGLCGREVPDPSPGTHPAGPPCLAGSARAAYPRLHPARHHDARRRG
jgi:hypothetical protein